MNILGQTVENRIEMMKAQVRLLEQLHADALTFGDRGLAEASEERISSTLGEISLQVAYKSTWAEENYWAER